MPPIVLLLVKDFHVENYDMSSVRGIMCATAPLSIEPAVAVEELFKKPDSTTVYCHQSWGLTETSPLATGVPLGRMDKRCTVGCITPHDNLPE